MNKFLKELMTLATELNQAEGFNAVTVINEMELLYDRHVTELKKLHIAGVSNCADLEQELEVTEKLLEERQRVLDAIPECPSHGKCVPHAIEWIEEMKAKHCC